MCIIEKALVNNLIIHHLYRCSRGFHILFLNISNDRKLADLHDFFRFPNLQLSVMMLSFRCFSQFFFHKICIDIHSLFLPPFIIFTQPIKGFLTYVFQCGYNSFFSFYYNIIFSVFKFFNINFCSVSLFFCVRRVFGVLYIFC